MVGFLRNKTLLKIRRLSFVLVDSKSSLHQVADGLEAGVVATKPNFYS